jgi:uncharacterized membrane protein
MSPISQRFLIPIFFVSIGLRVEWTLLFSWTSVMAFGTAGLLLVAREIIDRRWLGVACDKNAFLLLCPNLTVVALGASTLLDSRNSVVAAGWLLMTGLFLTVFAIILLPSVRAATGDPLPPSSGCKARHPGGETSIPRLPF